MASMEPKRFTVREVAAQLGLSEAVVRRHCQEGNCLAEFRDFPGTSRGFYLLTLDGIDWLRRHVTPRRSSNGDAA